MPLNTIDVLIMLAWAIPVGSAIAALLLLAWDVAHRDTPAWAQGAAAAAALAAAAGLWLLEPGASWWPVAVALLNPPASLWWVAPIGGLAMATATLLGDATTTSEQPATLEAPRSAA